MDCADEEPACDGRRDDSKLDVDGPVWMAGGFDGAGADFPTLEVDELIFGTVGSKVFQPWIR